jgi:hypothetical protein
LRNKSISGLAFKLVKKWYCEHESALPRCLQGKNNLGRRIYMIHYGFTKELDIPYETVVELAREALKKEGFGVLTEIDVKEKNEGKAEY